MSSVARVDGRIVMLGGGKMGEAIIAGLLAGAVSSDQLYVLERYPQRGDYLRGAYGVIVAQSVSELVDAGALVDATVVAAVKPQDVESVLAEIGSALDRRNLVISVAAGVTTARLRAGLGVEVPVIRAMPNTPALVGQGMTAIAPGGEVAAEHLAVAEALFGAVGRVVHVTEDQLDAVTAISGSGPAYFFLMVEALTDAGVHLGLPRPLAAQLASQTAAGAGAMVVVDGASPAQLRESVTSPGGTTAAALRAFDEAGFRRAVHAAVEAAHGRSRELGG